MYGGEVTVNGGTFESEGSGAFIMGTAADAVAKAKILNGTFTASGTSALSVYRYATVDLGEQGGSGSITMSGNSNAISIENTGNISGTTVNIHYGNYSGGQDGIWYGEGASSIHIAGGTFAATDRSGLYFAEVPNGKSVQLSGGVFSSERSADHRGNDTLLGNNRYWYNGGAISAATTTNSLGSVNGVLDINRNNIIAGNISLYGGDGGQLSDTDTVARIAQYTYIRVGAA